MPTVELKSQIQFLISLQTVDSEIYSLDKQRQAMPEEIKAIDAAFQEKRLNLDSLEKTLLDLQKQRKEVELELASKEESGKKLQSQLFSLKTNKEYQTMLQQIQGSKADASVIEDKILGILEKLDKIKVDVDRENARLKEEEKVSLDKIEIMLRQAIQDLERLKKISSV